MNATKIVLVEKHWMPPPKYVFPHYVLKQGKLTKKFAQKSYLEKCHWLVLSHMDKGLYYKYCVLFASSSAIVDLARSNPERLAKDPLKIFDNLLCKKGILTQHQRNHYHQVTIETE
jgi:hypothetical protein